MIALTDAAEILLHLPATDMRKSFDGLCGIVRQALGREPTDGSFFVFVNGRRDRVKILHWERDGFELWYRRLEEGTIEPLVDAQGQISATLAATELTMLLSGVALRSINRRKRYRRAA